ncbi:MAG: hypothetical protein A2145_01230 [candidate division Zixibacteria bacterium RBG_16_40_9]|nr:MAG: hypothetical protein A2145_01230 [candidate division Zixibacteria bacterium RBG_16_40_9]
MDFEKTSYTQGNILKSVWNLSWPIVSSYFLQTLVSLVDIKMVGVLGQENIAAIGLANSAIFVVLMIMMGMTVGSTALVARYVGEKSKEKVELVIQNSFVLSVILAVILTLAGTVFSAQILRWMGGEETVVKIGSSYMQIISGGAIFLTLNLIFSGLMIGMGKTKTNLYILGTINLLNVIGNYFFIYGIGFFPAMGTAGAALASTLSRGIGAFLAWRTVNKWGFTVTKNQQKIFHFDKEMIKKIVGIGLPVAIQALILRLSVIGLNKILSYTVYSTKAISAYTIGLATEAISFMPGIAFSTAATTLVGQNLGAGNISGAEKSGWTAMKFAAALMSVLGLFLIVFSKSVIGFFTEDATVVAIGSHYLIVNALAQPLIAVSMVTAGSLRGAGDAKVPMLVALFTLWGVRIPLAVILGLWLNFQTDGIWLAMFASILISSIYLSQRFKNGAWKSIKL